jgi:vancomycin resistance protein YoaR
MKSVPLLLAAGLGATLWMAAAIARAPAPEVVMAAYSTPLKARTKSQRHNAELAARALNDAVIPAGGTFSFNRRVKSWSLDMGYVKAPVSFEGDMVKAFGGGVCQTSTTLYNAALLAGLLPTERHPHVYSPGYSAPGRDAAVAYPSIDLKLHNPHPFPVRLTAVCGADDLIIKVIGAEMPKTEVRIESNILSRTDPVRLTRFETRPGRTVGSRYLRSPGSTGWHSVTYRIELANGREVKRERLSEDHYRAMNRVVALTTPEEPQP